MTSKAKEHLKQLLVQHDGDATHPEVEEALNDLIQLAEKEDKVRENNPAENAEINQGRWRSITTPPFPGKLPSDQDGKSKFTLGRMSFGMFKPTSTICSVEEIINIVEPIFDKEEAQGQGNGDGTWVQSYTIEVSVEILEASSGTKLPAKLMNYGQCFPQSPTRLGVKFTSGTLQPSFDMSNPNNTSLASAWKRLFDGAIEKEAGQQSYLGAFGTWAVHKLMGWMMGLEPPTDTKELTQTYVIKKPYTGYVDILYLDDDFRVTRGNKGTVVVTERLEAGNK